MKSYKIIIISILILMIAIFVIRFCISPQNGKKLTYDKPTHIVSVEDTRLFYNCMNENDKALYEIFLDLVNNKDTADYTSTVYMKTETFQELSFDHIWNVYYGMVFDHPEFFFLLTGGESRIEGYNSEIKDTTVLTFYLTEAPEGENQDIETFEKAADDFLLDIDLSAEKAEIELQIHDKLLEEITYDHELFESNYQDYYDLGATAYGALVSHKAICSGYASAFQYLLQRAGIPCAYVTGTAYYPEANNNRPDGTKDSNHAWNLVKLDDAYYEVDTTWDDFEMEDTDIDESFVNEMYEDTDAMYNVTHTFYNLTTREIEYYRQQENTTFYIEGYEPYNPSGDCHHYRGLNEELEDDPISIYLNNLLPEALGKAG